MNFNKYWWNFNIETRFVPARAVPWTESVSVVTLRLHRATAAIVETPNTPVSLTIIINKDVGSGSRDIALRQVEVAVRF